MQKTQEFYVIVVAAGTGQRFGSDIPKQYTHLSGRSIISHVIRKFQSCEGLKGMCVTIHPDHEIFYKNAIGNAKNVMFCYGGADRKSSVYNALKKISDLSKDSIILIHDAARPLVRREDICNLLKMMESESAATLAYPVTDTLRYADSNSNTRDIVSRDNLWAIQTPQAFKAGILRQAHESVSPDIEYTDDSSLVSALGVDVKIVMGDKSNFKITHQEDLDLANKMMPYETRVGSGFDVHRFGHENDADHVILCGVKIPHTKKLKGHSDADVGLHTLTDAILGAIGEGDIGLHFPPSDQSFKDMDSAIFLQKAVDMMREKSGHLVNADITLICECPKITPYRDAMQSRIADIMKVSKSRINVKGTTTEKLGFTGRQEGIAAQASVSVQFPQNLEDCEAS